MADHSNMNHLMEQFVVQKYLESPALYNGRKFDLRVFVFVSHQLKLYIFP